MAEEFYRARQCLKVRKSDVSPAASVRIKANYKEPDFYEHRKSNSMFEDIFVNKIIAMCVI